MAPTNFEIMKQYVKLLANTASPSKFLKEVRKDEEAMKELNSYIDSIEAICSFQDRENSCSLVKGAVNSLDEGIFIKYLAVNLPASQKINASNLSTCIYRVAKKRNLNGLEGVEITPYTDTAKGQDIDLKATEEKAAEEKAKKA